MKHILLILFSFFLVLQVFAQPEWCSDDNSYSENNITYLILKGTDYENAKKRLAIGISKYVVSYEFKRTFGEVISKKGKIDAKGKEVEQYLSSSEITTIKEDIKILLIYEQDRETEKKPSGEYYCIKYRIDTDYIKDAINTIENKIGKTIKALADSMNQKLNSNKTITTATLKKIQNISNIIKKSNFNVNTAFVNLKNVIDNHATLLDSNLSKLKNITIELGNISMVNQKKMLKNQDLMLKNQDKMIAALNEESRKLKEEIRQSRVKTIRSIILSIIIIVAIIGSWIVFLQQKFPSRLFHTKNLFYHKVRLKKIHKGEYFTIGGNKNPNNQFNIQLSNCRTEFFKLTRNDNDKIEYVYGKDDEYSITRSNYLFFIKGKPLEITQDEKQNMQSFKSFTISEKYIHIYHNAKKIYSIKIC